MLQKRENVNLHIRKGQVLCNSDVDSWETPGGLEVEQKPLKYLTEATDQGKPS